MFSQIKRRIGVLAAVAVMAALVPAITSSPASATTAAGTTGVALTVVGSPATYSACPTGSAPAAGFTDTTSTDVDCIAMYGITTGTTATTYSPTDSVPRWAMALYLTRALEPAGGTLGAGVSQGFTDISGKSAEIILAIDQLAELGITLGTGDGTTFSPDDNVSREEMAMFIERWLENVKAGPGGQSDADGLVAAATTTYVTSDCAGATACTGKYNYTDIDAGSVTVEGANAIKELYDLGIHDGVSATTFNPSSDMTRAAMATFMTAALGHTNARPAGLTIQASLYTNAGSHTPTLSVSDRDASFAPISGTPVDVFYWTTSTTEGNAAFGATGLCDDSVATGAAITACKIDSGEPTTNTNGNVVPTAVQTDPYATIYQGSDVYYAWTAASGTIYDNDLHGSGDDYSSITVAATAAAAGTTCSIDTPANALTATAAHTVAFGTVTTITCQVKDGGAATSGNVAKASQKVIYTNTRVFTTDSSGVQSGTIMTEEIVGSTDANGQVQFTVTGPTDTAGTDVVTDSITVEDVTINDIYNATLASVSGHMATNGTDTLSFSLAYTDTTAAAATSSLTANATSGLANAVTGLTRTYTGTVYDQYGGTVSGNAATFNSTSTLPGGLACTLATPTVCTTLAVHGLAVGDDVIVTGLGAAQLGIGDQPLTANAAAAGATPTTGSSFVVATVPSTTTFTLDDASGNDLGGSTTHATPAASTDASPITAVTSSTANAARTTTSDGTIAFSWTDTEGTSGKDTITFTPTTATASTSTFYRLAAASDFTSTDANGDDATDSETYAKLVEWDGTNNDFILEITDDTDATNSVLSYKQYTFDSNDHFATGGTSSALNGNPVTMAAWETAMGTASLTTGGTANDVVYVDYGTGISSDINRFTQN